MFALSICISTALIMQFSFWTWLGGPHGKMVEHKVPLLIITRFNSNKLVSYAFRYSSAIEWKFKYIRVSSIYCGRVP